MGLRHDELGNPSSGYRFGRWVGEHPWIAGGGALAIVGYTLFSGPVAAPPAPERSPADLAEYRAKVEAQQKAAAEVQRQQCINEFLPMAKGEAKLGKMMAARATLATCHAHLTEPADKAFLQKVTAQAETEEKRHQQRLQAEAKAYKKRHGVSLGMSQQDVIDSSWGKPRKINRTIYSHGTHEQWVYDGGYLYFEDGVLKTIQN